MIYQFKAKELKTGNEVIGDLAYAYAPFEKSHKTKPMIVTHRIHGGMVWLSQRFFVDESTIEPIKVE